MERHKDAIGAHEAEPEMKFAHSLVHHSPGHLGEPEVSTSEDAKHGGNTHHQVEMADHEVSRMEHDIDGGLSQEEAAHATADEHRNKAQGKQGSRVDAQLGTIQTERPHQHHDGGRDGYDQRGERERQRGERIHPADKHVMPIDHVAEDGKRSHGIDEYSLTKHRLAHVGDQDMGDDADTGYDRDVDLRMSEEPEQVLPEESRSSGVRQHLVVHHQIR